ncbi:MAG TPA: hypothetical protein VF743_00290 [Acidimicrobiales bacterium]
MPPPPQPHEPPDGPESRPDPGAADRPDDPVLVRRRRIARLADMGQRAGYLLFGLAVLLFVVGAATDFPRAVVTGVVVALAVGSVLLAPAIVAGYAVRAADREDRERGLS